MILYTPMPLEHVLAVDDQAAPDYREVEYCGISFLVQTGERGMGKIVQIRSTDPYVYLKPEFQPGKEIPLFNKV